MPKPEANYVPINPWDALDEQENINVKRRSLWFSWRDAALLISVVSSLLLAIAALHNSRIPPAVDSSFHTSILGPEIDIERWIPNLWVSDYSSADVAGMDQVDLNWDAIRPAHGIVAVDHQWAAQNGLPPSKNLESDSSKGVYTLDAYHALHCVIIIRRTMFQLARRETLDMPVGHSTHCFDALRQHIMCKADDTLLYQKHNTSDGDGQMRRCRNWGALRDWAGEHSACFRDNEEGVAHEDRVNCRNSGDGLIIRD